MYSEISEHDDRYLVGRAPDVIAGNPVRFAPPSVGYARFALPERAAVLPIVRDVIPWCCAIIPRRVTVNRQDVRLGEPIADTNGTTKGYAVEFQEDCRTADSCDLMGSGHQFVSSEPVPTLPELALEPGSYEVAIYWELRYFRRGRVKRDGVVFPVLSAKASKIDRVRIVHRFSVHGSETEAFEPVGDGSDARLLAGFAKQRGAKTNLDRPHLVGRRGRVCSVSFASSSFGLADRYSVFVGHAAVEVGGERYWLSRSPGTPDPEWISLSGPARHNYITGLVPGLSEVSRADFVLVPNPSLALRWDGSGIKPGGAYWHTEIRLRDLPVVWQDGMR